MWIIVLKLLNTNFQVISKMLWSTIYHPHHSEVHIKPHHYSHRLESHRARISSSTHLLEIPHIHCKGAMIHAQTPLLRSEPINSVALNNAVEEVDVQGPSGFDLVPP